MSLEGIPDPTPATPFYNSVRDATHDPTVPELIDQTNDLVTDFLEANKLFANEAVADAQAAMAALADAKLPPALPDPPPAPSIVTSVNGSIGLNFDTQPELGAISNDQGAFSTFDADAVDIPDISGEIPAYVQIVNGISIPEAPAFTLPSDPLVPGIDTSLNLPSAPAQSYGASPVLLDFNMPVYTPVVLPVFGDAAPEFDVLPPEPVINWTEPTYSSDVKEAVRLTLLSMLAGGTGLPEDVERAIWERGRAREEAGAAKSIEEAIEQWAVRGFSAPQGYLDGKIYALRDDTRMKINAMSRDVMVKQAELEQTNRNFAVEKGISYEQVFTTLFLQVVERNFQIAKFTVETQVQIYNMRVTAFNAEQQVFAQKITLYRAQLEGAFAYLKAFDSLVMAEKAKAEVNVARVQAFEAKVKAYSAQVDAFKALIEGEKIRSEIQKTRIEVYKAQVEGQVAKIQGKRSEFDAYVARVQGESAKAGLEEANSRAYVARVQGIALKNDINVKRADVQIQANRLNLDFDIANMNRVSTLHGTELAKIQANLAAFQALTSKATAKYSTDKERLGFELQSQIELSRIAIAKYQALLEQWKVRAGEIIQMANINAESLRAAGVIASNLASGAMAGTHVSAGISAGASAGETHGVSTSNQSSQSKSEGTSNSYSVSHDFSHKV